MLEDDVTRCGFYVRLNSIVLVSRLSCALIKAAYTQDTVSTYRILCPRTGYCACFQVGGSFDELRGGEFL